MANIISPDTFIDFSTADKFIGATLQAVKAITVYTNGTGSGKVVAVVKAGENVGKIYSWIKGADGGVWWSVDRSGKHFGYCKHEYDSFNGEKAVESSDLYKTEVKKQVDQFANTSDFLSFLDDFPILGGMNLDRITKLVILIAGLFLGFKVFGFLKRK
jgi:hypothetical protein